MMLLFIFRINAEVLDVGGPKDVHASAVPPTGHFQLTDLFHITRPNGEGSHALDLKGLDTAIKLPTVNLPDTGKHVEKSDSNTKSDNPEQKGTLKNEKHNQSPLEKAESTPLLKIKEEKQVSLTPIKKKWTAVQIAKWTALALVITFIIGSIGMVIGGVVAQKQMQDAMDTAQNDATQTTGSNQPVGNQ